MYLTALVTVDITILLVNGFMCLERLRCFLVGALIVGRSIAYIKGVFLSGQDLTLCL